MAGCFNDGFDCTYCEPPDEAVMELRVHGVTLTTFITPFPEDVHQEYYPATDMMSAEVEIRFAPHPDHAWIEPLPPPEISLYPYEYSFSMHNDAGGVEELPGGVQDASPLSESDPGYYGGLSFDLGPPQFIEESSNHVLSGGYLTRIPAKATHVNLWWRSSEMARRELVRSVPLENLHAWRKYYLPLIPGGN